ncbi:metallophosphoesterase [Cohnella fermenti]|uniref:metallophosphoesterase n=1 Tax=Cohnella fermenti TaxID=2565925 RepID=UPI001E312415|nr:metallophosphoesterase [Cohnella fermenti]
MKKAVSSLTVLSMLLTLVFTMGVTDSAVAEEESGSVLFAQNSEWSYLDDGSNQGTAWRSVDYDDSAWKQDAAPLGYASSGKGLDLNTWIGYGSNSSSKYITTYFRKEFEVTDTSEIKQLLGTLIRDDGAVIYLNGEEVYRVNMPSGTIAYTTLASGAVGDERPSEEFSISPSLLVTGRNVIAAEVHQNAGTSSDLFFSLELKASDTSPYAPIAIAMSLYGSAKTARSFAWYTNYANPQNAPENVMDSIVEVVPAGEGFDSPAKLRFTGDPKDTQALSLKVTSSTNGSFISHKAVADGLTPGTDYEYRVGSDGLWSETGSFTTEAEEENSFEFLYMTDSQGSNTGDYEVWANTLGNGLNDFPNAKFLVMTGDQVDAGSLESQWLDYFGKPQQLLLNLPIMAAVGNHEGPYNDNYYYHFNYPNDSIDDPLPPGSVYSFDYGDAHIMVLNTMDINWDSRQSASFDQQIDWLKREVAETDKKWKIVAYHKAIYSLGNHTEDSDILALREKLYPIFDELGIDVVLQGHDHTFVRSYQMYGNQRVTDIETDADGNPLNPDGTLYMINNSAGTKYYNLQTKNAEKYAAVYEQPYQPIYSGIRMTGNSFTIDSYKSGEDQPFDTYTIVRDDEKPNPVSELKAASTSSGKTLLSWTKPADRSDSADPIRGFRIYETSGKLGANWSQYIPVVEGQTSYQLTMEGTNADEVYEFAVKSVDKRDNSEAELVSTEGAKPLAPTAPVVDDGHNTFGWTNAPGYSEAGDYEYSVDNGATWQPVTANPQPLGAFDYPAGTVLVRVQANEAAGTPAGEALASDRSFTENDIRDTYELTGTITRGDQIRIDVTAERIAEYGGDAYLVLELMNGNTPVLLNAVSLKQDKLSLTQYFNVSGDSYRIKAYVFDTFDGELDVPVQLARPIELQ